jgi:hypothetical protein
MRGPLKSKMEAEIYLPHDMFIKLVHPLNERFFNNAVDLHLSTIMNTNNDRIQNELDSNKSRLKEIGKYPLTINDNLFRALKTIEDTNGIALMQEKTLTEDEHKLVQDAIHENMPDVFSDMRSWDLLKRVGYVLQIHAGPRSVGRKKAMKQLVNHVKINSVELESGKKLKMDSSKWLDMIENNVQERDRRKNNTKK